MAAGACEMVTTSALVGMFLVAALGSTAGRGSTAGAASLRVRLAALAAVSGGSPAAQRETAQPDAAAERFDAALAAWLPKQRAALAAIDEVVAGRRQPDALADVRAVLVYVCPNGLGNRLPGEDPTLLRPSRADLGRSMQWSSPRYSA